MTVPIFTLTTDFGTREGYVGAMKGRILSQVPGAQIVDISHDIPAQDVRTAAWTIRRASAQFPPGSIHIVVVDPGVGSARAALLVRHAGQWYVGPDNGVLSLCWLENQPEAVYRLHRKTDWWQSHQSFDGLSLFAPAACCLAAGMPVEQLGVRQIQYQCIEIPQPHFSAGTLIGEILHFDHFGNGITNIRLDKLRAFAETPFSIRCVSVTYALADHYAEGQSGQAIAIINSDGLLELCCFGKSAQECFGLRRGELVMVQEMPRQK